MYKCTRVAFYTSKVNFCFYFYPSTLLHFAALCKFWLLCVFRNLCLSTRPNCKKDDLLLLWEHECQWVFGHRMVNSVDFDRYSTTFFQAVRKTFTSDEHVSRLAVARESLSCST